MMQQEGSSSPSRNANLTKRKIADTFYNPSFIKAQNFSDAESSQMAVPALNNFYEKTGYMYTQQNPSLQQQQSCSTTNVNQLTSSYMNTSIQANHDFHTNGPSQHLKTYSLPTSLDSQSNYTMNLPPRTINANGDIPLPPGNYAKYRSLSILE
jgi:hypothetical protein